MKNRQQFYSIANLLSLRDKGQREPQRDGWNPDKMFNVEEGDDVSIIRIYDEIGFWGIDARDIVNMIESVKGNSIQLRINSPGGNIFDGITIMNALAALNKPIDVYIDGIAASIASVIAMAGDEITMPENTRMMIHNPWILSIGSAKDLRKDADTLDLLKTDIIATYRTHSDLSVDEISALMDEETYLSAQDAVEKGFATKFVPLSQKGENGNNNNENNNKAKREREISLYEMEAFA